MKHPDSIRSAGDVEPFFSIGVVTYNRREMLKECLASILQQTFSDFGVIVGNDYPGETLSADVLSIKDSRIRFINHRHNLGEMNNLNAVLAASRGRYFTWLGDDDLFAPNFLEAVHSALLEFDFPRCVFTAYSSGKTFQHEGAGGIEQARLYTGREFLRLYLSRQLKAVGCYGVFVRDYLTQSGGMKQLGSGFSPYSDNLLAIRAGLLDRVGYIDAPLVFYRTHEGSMSYTSGDVAAFSSAQEDLFRRSMLIFRSEGLRDELQSNLFLLLRWCLVDFGSVVRKAGGIGIRQAIAYARFAFRHVNLLQGSPQYWPGLVLLGKVALWTAREVGKARLRQWRPSG